MGEGQSDWAGSPTPHETQRQLAGLLETPIGTVIYDQLMGVVEEWKGAQGKIAHTYLTLVHLLVKEYARDPSIENVTDINARLIQARLASPAPRLDIHTLKHAVTASETVALDSAGTGLWPGNDTLAQTVTALVEGLMQMTAGPPPAPPDSATAAPVAAPPPARKADEPQVPEVERRVNSAYRLHLERKRDEIEKLQETLANKVTEAIAQNREFGALLEIELGALQQADSIDEITDLKQILIGGIEELLQGQRALAAKLSGTSEYLRIIESDSERLHDELHKVRLLSLTDEFTGLPNRRAFMRRLEDEIGRAQRYGTPLAVAILDLDEFKAINDEYGHMAGDEVLRSYAAHVLSIFRHHDMVARYGGEEFSVLLPNTEKEGALRALSKVQSRALKTAWEYNGKVLPLPTFSTGLTFYVPGEETGSLLERADRALYRAKHLGRNRVEVEVPENRPVTDPGVTNG